MLKTWFVLSLIKKENYMKNIRVLTIIFLMLLLSACSGERVTVDLKVIDQDGAPLEGVKADLGFVLPSGGTNYVNDTDDQGRLSVTRRAAYGVSILLTKPGYYASRRRTGYGDQTLTMELREIKKPIAMYVHKLRKMRIDTDKEYGYDLKGGDFTPPHGKGEVEDLLVTITGEEKSVWDKELYMKIRFSNPLDGLVPFIIENPENNAKSKPESLYKSDYLAPEQGYQHEWGFHEISKGKKSPYDTNLDRTKNYYFRVRTKTNEEGDIESAHYGKIYGEFFTSTITHYFNPTPNDRNVEFDLARNLSPKKIIGEVRP